jgi:tetratricopeptide (TPR) repeat protein
LKTIESLKRGVSKARRLWREERVDEALAEVEHLLQAWPNNPHLLVMRADLIRLQDDEDGTPTLSDAKSDLELAVALDEDSPAPLIELGYFVYVIEDDATTALKHFQKAIRLCRSLLKDALIGQAKALSELGREAEAVLSLTEAYSHDGKSDGKEILEQLRQLQRIE